MSKIALSGNASGTGTLTIAAPNTNTDRTLNLPDAAGTIQVSGNPISGTTGTFTGLMDISAAGAGQIAFPATQNASANANTLDDYEEGTFTPFFVPDGGAFTTLTYSAQTGKYTKIGNFVFFSINIFTSVVTLGTASGGLAIGGLPFTSDATTQLAPGVALGRVYRWANAIPNIRCNIDTNSTLIRLPNMATNSTSATNAQVTDLTTGSNSFYNCVDIGGCYKIV
jgi:hypothetical protein